MSSKLYSLGKWAYKARNLVVILWIIILAGIGSLALTLQQGLDNSITIPGTESQQALDQLVNTFPEVSGGSARISVVGENAQTLKDTSVQATVEETVAEIGKISVVNSVLSPFDSDIGDMISDNGRAAIINIQLSTNTFDTPKEVKDQLVEINNDLGAKLEGQAEVAIGGDLYSTDIPTVSTTELIGVAVALVVLIMTFGSLLMAGLPLLSAIIGVGASMGLVFIATAFSNIMSTTPLLALMLGLAVGIDYALFIMSRHQEQIKLGIEPEESVGRAIATSGSAVIFAGLTVIIALLGLSVAGIPFLTTMGIWAAVAVGISVLVSLTFTPAILGYVGERAINKRARKHRDEYREQQLHLSTQENQLANNDSTQAIPVQANQSQTNQPHRSLADRFFRGWVKTAIKVPLLTIVIIVAALGALSLPAMDLKLALPDAGGLSEDHQARINYDSLTEHFGPGFNGPLILTGDIVKSTDPLGLMDDIKKEVEKLDGVKSVPLATPNTTADTGIVQIVPTGAPDSDETKQLVHDLRDLRPHLIDTYDFDSAVTGFTAVGIDVSEKLAEALLPFGIIVVGLSLILLAIVFRSIWVPIKATLGYLLTIGSTFGVITLVFGQGFMAGFFNVAKAGPVISFMPIILMGILFGLAMDYQMFLVSRMREHYTHTKKAQESIVEGFVGSAKVVTAAAVIMISVFMAFVPDGDVNIKPIALGLAVGVFVDAFIIRMTLVPAIMALLGNHAWWIPAWLEKLLPHFDVEGEGINTELAINDWESDPDTLVAIADLELPTIDEELDDLVLSFTMKQGSHLLIQGPDVWTSFVGKVISGRILPQSGKSKVLQLALPMRANSVRHRVAYVDCDPVTAGTSLEHQLHMLDREVAKLPELIVVNLPESIPDSLSRALRHLIQMQDLNTSETNDHAIHFIALDHGNIPNNIFGEAPLKRIDLLTKGNTQIPPISTTAQDDAWSASATKGFDQ